MAKVRKDRHTAKPPANSPVLSQYSTRLLKQKLFKVRKKGHKQDKRTDHPSLEMVRS